MNVPGVAGLLDDIKVAFVVPTVFYVLTVLVDRATPHALSKTLFRRIALLLVLITFVVFLPTLLYQDRPVLIALWQQSPLVYSLVYVIFIAGVASGVAGLWYWRLRPSRWRPITVEERRLAARDARYREEKRRLFRLDGDPPPEDDAEAKER